MYEKFYGLRIKPFRLSPDPQFFFTSATHKSALAYLQYGLYQSEGFVVVTGGAGTGKTMLIRTLLSALSRREMVIGELMTTQLQPDDLLRLIAAAFRLDPLGAKSEVLGRLHTFLVGRARAGQRVLLVIDEAHNLPQSSFEELRMLSNLQQGAHALLQCILLGQPPLRDLLARAQMEQLQQRVIAAHHLHPLGVEETREYILHRLRKAGWCGDPAFSADAVVLIYRYSQGIPRRINSLCDRLLLFGALENTHHLDSAAAMQVFKEWAEETGQGLGAESPFSNDDSAVVIEGLAAEHACLIPPTSVASVSDERAARRAGVDAPAGRDQVSSTFFASPLFSTFNILPRTNAWRRSLGGVAAVLAAIAVVFFLLPAGDVEHVAESTHPPPALAHEQSAPSSFDSAKNANTIAVRPAAEIVSPREFGVAQTSLQRSEWMPEHTTEAKRNAVAAAEPVEISSPTKTRVAKEVPPRAASAPVAPSVSLPVNHERASKTPHAGAERMTPAASAHLLPVNAGSEEDLNRQTINAESVAAASVELQNSAITKAAKVPPESLPVVVSEKELTAVLDRFQNAYETGNMRELISLFARDARSDEAADRDAIARTYEKLFNLTDARHLALKDMHWQEAGEAMKGEGQFGVTVRERGRGLESSYTGRISLRIEKRDGQAVITRLEHSYTQ